MSETGPYAVFQWRPFRYFFLFRFFLELGLLTQVVVVAWQVYDLTKDPLSLGLIGLCEFLPAITLSLLAGHFVDRSNRYRMVIASSLVSSLVILSLWLMSVLSLSNHSHVLLIYLAMAISGGARAFLSPSIFSLFGEVVPKSHYLSASVWTSTAWQIAAAIGPAVGGLVYGFAGIRKAYATAFFLSLAGILSLIPVRDRRPMPPSQKEPMAESLFKGLNFVFAEKTVLSALTLDLFAVLFGGAVALLPIFADQILHVGPQGLGLMRSAPALGAILMSLYLAHRPPSRKAGKKLLTAVTAFGLCMIVFGLSRNFYLSLFVLFLSGAFDNVSVVLRSTILQMRTPDSMRGRVSAVNSVFIGSSNEIGDFESGLTAKWWGTVPAVVIGGCLTLLVTLTMTLRAKSLRSLDFEKNPS